MVYTTTCTILLADTLALGLLCVLVVAGDVHEDVQRPSDELLTNEMKHSRNWSLLSHLVDFVHGLSNPARVLLTSLRYEHHVAVHVAGRLVVLAVRDLPREVRDEEARVYNPTNGVVESLGRRKRLVTTFVGQHPQTCGEKALQDCVDGP